jgi:hypothetical protein
MEESRIVMKLLRARSSALFTLSARARFFAALRMTAIRLRMIALGDISVAFEPRLYENHRAPGFGPRP